MNPKADRLQERSAVRRSFPGWCSGGAVCTEAAAAAAAGFGASAARPCVCLPSDRQRRTGSVCEGARLGTPLQQHAHSRCALCSAPSHTLASLPAEAKLKVRATPACTARQCLSIISSLCRGCSPADFRRHAGGRQPDGHLIHLPGWLCSSEYHTATTGMSVVAVKGICWFGCITMRA